MRLWVWRYVWTVAIRLECADAVLDWIEERYVCLAVKCKKLAETDRMDP